MQAKPLQSVCIWSRFWAGFIATIEVKVENVFMAFNFVISSYSMMMVMMMVVTLINDYDDRR